MSPGPSVESCTSCSLLLAAAATSAPKGASVSGISLRALGDTAGSANIKNAIASMNEPLGLRRASSKSRTMRRNGHKRAYRLKYLSGSFGIDAVHSARTAVATAKPACLLARTHPGVPPIRAFFIESTLASALHSTIRVHAFKTGAGRCHSTAFFRAVSRQY